jgi:hypothetical protein
MNLNQKKQMNKYYTRFISSINEWNNSVFLYNKNIMRTLHLKNKMVYSFINNYFVLNYETISKNKLKNKLINLKKINNKNYTLNNILMHNNVKNIFFNFKNSKYNFIKNIKSYIKHNIYIKSLKSEINYTFKSLDVKLRKSSLFWRQNKYNILKKNYYISLNRIFISKPEIKHTFNKIKIILYTFNRERFFILKNIHKLKSTNKYLFNNKYYSLNIRRRIKKKLSNSHFLNKYIKVGILNKTRIYLKKIFNSIIWKELLKNFFSNYHNIKNFEYNPSYINELKNNFFIKNIISYEKQLKFFSLISKNIFNNKIENKNKNLLFYKYDFYIINILKAILIKKLIKNLLLKYLIGKLYLNNFKYNLINMINLKKNIGYIYNKQIEIKLINLKNFNLDNNIFLENISRKLRDRTKRALKVIRKALNLIITAKPLYNLEEKKNNLNYNLIRYKNYIYNSISYNNIIIFRNLKNTHITGIRVEAKGRLTKRMTASRSLYKLAYKGNLKNLHSIYFNKPITLLKNFEKSNINYEIINSKQKNGAFGIKSRISTY